MILLAVAVTGVLNLRLWGARVRVPACEKELGIVRPFITCRAVLRRPGGGARCPGLPVFTTLFLRCGRGGGRETQLASVPPAQGGLQQLEREQMGTFSAGAAPPLTRPRSLPSRSVSSMLRRKHLAGCLAVETLSEVLPLISWWISRGSLHGKLITHRRANTCIVAFALLLCSVVRLDVSHYADFRYTACLRLGV